MNEKDEKLNKGSFLYIGDQNKAEWGYPEGYPKKSVQTTTLMEEQELAFETSNGTLYAAQPTTALELVVGQTYIVKWDGTKYECVGVALAENVPAIGNLSIMGRDDDTGEPFLCIHAEIGFVTRDTSAIHTISVKTIQETVAPMAEKYLPTIPADKLPTIPADKLPTIPADKLPTIPVIEFTDKISTNIANDTQPSFNVSNLSYSEIYAIVEKGIFQIEDSSGIRYSPTKYWIDSSGNICVVIIDISISATYAVLICAAGEAIFYRNSWWQIEATQK